MSGTAPYCIPAASYSPTSDRLERFLRVIVVIMTACSVAFSAMYAVQLGESWAFQAIIALAAVGIECSLVIFAARMYPPLVIAFFRGVAGVGVILISVFTAASFMLSQQYAQDHKVSELTKSYLSGLLSDAEKLSATDRDSRGTLAVTRDRIEATIKEYRRSGATGSKATASYHAIAKALSVTVETVSLVIRLIWAVTFVAISIALSSYLEEYFSTGKEGGEVEFVPEDEEKERKERAPTRDTGTAGGTPHSTRYNEVRELIASGLLTPSVAKLKSQGIGTDTAREYLKALERDGIIYRNGQGYRPVSTA